jgi:deaminated glutathione amidase
MTSQRKFKAGLVQTRTGRDADANLVTTTALIREAASGGAEYVQTPEMTNIMELDRDRLLTWTWPEEGNPAVAHFQALARELGIWLHIGSLAVALPDGGLVNRSYVIAPDGAIRARYDKIHMFDVDLANGESFRESERFRPGRKAVVCELPWGRLGLTICYDLRFPHLYRALAQAGASVLAVPSAFTRQTGEAHWHTLLRARAIETASFVLAAAQAGRHESGRVTYGHSLAVSPWGDVIAEGGTETGIVMAEIDLSAGTEARARIPALMHDMPFQLAAGARPPLREAS